MKQILQFFGVILSVWLALVAHVPISQGQVTPTEPSMLVQEYYYDDNGSKLYQIWPDTDQKRLLTPDSISELWIIGIDGQHERVYFTSAGIDDLHSNVSWTDGNQTELLVENRPYMARGKISHSIDMQWLFLSQENAEGQLEQWLFNTVTGQHIGISEILPPQTESSTGEILSVDKAGWLYFTVKYTYSNNNNPHAIYRISLQDNTAQNLTPDLVGEVYLVGYSADSEWLFYRWDKRLYQMRRDGSDKRPMVPDSAFDFTVWTDQQIYQYFPVQRVAFVECKYGLCAVDVDSGMVVWSDNNVHFRLLHDSGASDWVLVRNDDLLLERLYVVDGRREPIFPDSVERDANPLAFSPDRQWLIYGTQQDADSGFNLKRIHLETGEQQMIREDLAGGTFEAWSPDGQWLIWDIEGIHGGLYRVHISDGRFERLTEDGYGFRGWFR